MICENNDHKKHSTFSHFVFASGNWNMNENNNFSLRWQCERNEQKKYRLSQLHVINWCYFALISWWISFTSISSCVTVSFSKSSIFSVFIDLILYILSEFQLVLLNADNLTNKRTMISKKFCCRFHWWCNAILHLFFL